jgi:phospholipid-binding lipoprotein MlaA
MGRADRWARLTTVWGLVALLSACASIPRDPSMPINDPNEDLNRKVLKFNQFAIDPAANVVKAVTPGPVMNRLSDLDANIKEPRIFANDILQGRLNAATVTLARFVVNTTFGLGGLFDVASTGGLPQQTGDFGQTLFVWGVPDGPFAERPYFGPATTRDSFGGLVDTVADPVGWTIGGVLGWGWTAGAAGLGAVVHLGQWQEAENASIDFYSFLRSSYYQSRRADLRQGLGLPPVTESPATASPAR